MRLFSGIYGKWSSWAQLFAVWIPINAKHFFRQLNFPCTTKKYFVASRCLNILCESLPKEKQIQFYARYITTNPWRIVDSVFRNLCCQEMHIADLEISLIFEHFLIETGLDPSNLPFINNVCFVYLYRNNILVSTFIKIIITRKNQLNIVNDEVLQKKAKSMPIENNEKKENQKICSVKYFCINVFYLQYFSFGTSFVHQICLKNFLPSYMIPYK